MSIDLSVSEKTFVYDYQVWSKGMLQLLKDENIDEEFLFARACRNLGKPFDDTATVWIRVLTPEAAHRVQNSKDSDDERFITHEHIHSKYQIGKKFLNHLKRYKQPVSRISDLQRMYRFGAQTIVSTKEENQLLREYQPYMKYWYEAYEQITDHLIFVPQEYTKWKTALRTQPTTSFKKYTPKEVDKLFVTRL